MKEIKLFLESKKKTSCANTLAAYERDMNDFSDFILKSGKSSPLEIDCGDILAYTQSLKERLSDVSISRRISVIRSFYNYMGKSGIIKENPAKNIKKDSYCKKDFDILSKKEVSDLLSQPDNSGVKGLRDRAMLELLYATGMRVSEMLSLDLKNINLTTGVVECSENKRRRSIILYDLAIEQLKKYITITRPILLKGKPDNEALFLNTSGERITRQGFWKILKHYAEKAGIDRSISPHTLRHSFAAHLLENGASAKKVQELMGNSDSASINEYVKFLKSKAKDDVIKHHPRAKKSV